MRQPAGTVWLLAYLVAFLIFLPAGDVIATGLKLSAATTGNDGTISVHLTNSQVNFVIECKTTVDSSCTLPALGPLYTLKKSGKRLYVGDNLVLIDGEKESGHFRLVSMAVK